LRNAKDFEAEQALDQAFKRQDDTFETIYLIAKQTLQDLSSSSLKAVLKEQ
jgi:phosphopantetheine adenylyltransferase